MQISSTDFSTVSVEEKPRPEIRKIRSRKPSVSIEDQEAREEAIKKCFRAGMSPSQIVRMSESWKHPIKTPRRVLQIQKRLHLVRKSPVQPHVKNSNDFLIDVILECEAKGWKTMFWEKEHELPGFRADWFLEVRKGKRIHFYYGEMQRSDLHPSKWLSKLGPYLDTFKEKLYLQHVLIRCIGVRNEQRAVEAVDRLLGDWKTCRLFLISKGEKWLNRAGELRELIE